MAASVDVLAALDAQVASAKSLQSDAYWVQELPKLEALRAAVADLIGGARFVMAFYEPGQTYLDTNAWAQAEASLRAALRRCTGEGK